MTESIVIVGNGIAAISAIKSIREIDKFCKIHLIGEEKFYPYNRVRLSKGLLSGLEENKILIQKKEWYSENDVILYLDNKVISIDTNKRVVELSDGKIIGYTKLLLASGSHNVTPLISGINKHGVYTLKTLQDAWDIIERLEDAQIVLIIGGGVQGLETAWMMVQAGKKVILSHRSPRFMRTQLDEKASKLLEKAVLSSNIQILFNTQVSEVKGYDKVEGFMTTDGKSYECDTIIYSVGTKPNIDILNNTPIKTNNGIIVNEKMETNVESIYAAGDVAEYNNQIYGLWNIAIGQGKVAGYNIIGKDSIYKNIIPLTTLNAFNLSLFSMGIVDESKATDIVIDDRSEEGIYNKVLINNDKVIGAIVVGNIKVSPALKSAIEKETSLKGIDYNNTSFDELIQVIKNNK